MKFEVKSRLRSDQKGHLRRNPSDTPRTLWYIPPKKNQRGWGGKKRNILLHCIACKCCKKKTLRHLLTALHLLASETQIIIEMSSVASIKPQSDLFTKHICRLILVSEPLVFFFLSFLKHQFENKQLLLVAVGNRRRPTETSIRGKEAFDKIYHLSSRREGKTSQRRNRTCRCLHPSIDVIKAVLPLLLVKPHVVVKK